jgi:hypothetical protein
LSFFLASSEANVLFKVASATSTPSIGDRSGEVLLGVEFWGGGRTGVTAVWLMVTPFLTTLIFCGTSFLFEPPHNWVGGGILSLEWNCEAEVARDEEDFAVSEVRK